MSRYDSESNIDSLRFTDNEDLEEFGLEAEKVLEKTSSEILEIWKKGIDFDRQRAIFESIVKPSGRQDVNVMGKDDFLTEFESPHLLDIPSALGEYSPKSNKAYIQVGAIVALSEFSKDEKEAQVLHVVSHETAHAIGKVECDGFRNNDVGFAQVVGSEETGYMGVFGPLDEAIAEKIGREVTSRYIESDPKREDLKKMFAEGKLFGYDTLLKFLDGLIELISKKTEISKEVVWEGILDGYLKGENLIDPEITDGLESMFYQGLMFDIATIEDDEGAERVLAKLQSGSSVSVFDEMMDDIKKRLEAGF